MTETQRFSYSYSLLTTYIKENLLWQNQGISVQML